MKDALIKVMMRLCYRSKANRMDRCSSLSSGSGQDVVSRPLPSSCFPTGQATSCHNLELSAPLSDRLLRHHAHLRHRHLLHLLQPRHHRHLSNPPRRHRQCPQVHPCCPLYRRLNCLTPHRRFHRQCDLPRRRFRRQCDLHRRMVFSPNSMGRQTRASPRRLQRSPNCTSLELPTCTIPLLLQTSGIHPPQTLTIHGRRSRVAAVRS